MLFCCCSKSRGAADEPKGRVTPPETLYPPGSLTNSKATARVLMEFLNEESKLCLSEASFIEVVEKLRHVKGLNGAIEKKEIAKIYKSIRFCNVELIKNFLVQDFFFFGHGRAAFDYSKIFLFNLIYCDNGWLSDEQKASALFDLIDQEGSGIIEAHSKNLIDVL